MRRLRASPRTKLTFSTKILRASVNIGGSIFDASAYLCNTECVKLMSGYSLPIKPLKPDLQPIMVGAPSVFTAETMLQERPLLVKKLSKSLLRLSLLQLLRACRMETLTLPGALVAYE
ncbi:unnamed protein product [Clavelina lepadiformis]|uniref:Uncharacterized protein n=1 Tax=Clavelina lepadiformis TaxID=159417 RepID=A0ABP0GTV6_CLALP